MGLMIFIVVIPKEGLADGAHCQPFFYYDTEYTILICEGCRL